MPGINELGVRVQDFGLSVEDLGFHLILPVSHKRVVLVHCLQPAINGSRIQCLQEFGCVKFNSREKCPGYRGRISLCHLIKSLLFS
jgi:hypothetical protein